MEKEKLMTASLATMAVLIVFLLIGIAFFLGRESVQFNGNSGDDTILGPTPLLPDQIMCTKEAKLCPDGSYVGRSGPNCEFTPCSGSDPGLIPEPLPDGPYTEPSGRMCTQEMKQCPNGGAVARTGPNCEFAPCPTKK
ncbi:MAG: hypothetical protein WCG84_00305 [Candidatus Moraniibacteriota bacterium]